MMWQRHEKDEESSNMNMRLLGKFVENGIKTFVLTQILFFWNVYMHFFFQIVFLMISLNIPWIWGNSFWGLWDNSKFKGSEAGVCLTCMITSEGRAARIEWRRDDAREMGLRILSQGETEWSLGRRPVVTRQVFNDQLVPLRWWWWWLSWAE